MTTVESESKSDPRLDPLRALVVELDAAEKDVSGWRERRNREIARLRQLKDAPTIEAIGRAAGVRHSYVSRVAKGGGSPASGPKP